MCPATLRARALWAVWRRCSLLTDRCEYARRSRLAIQPKALSRGAHGYFNRLLRIGNGWRRGPKGGRFELRRGFGGRRGEHFRMKMDDRDEAEAQDRNEQ